MYKRISKISHLVFLFSKNLSRINFFWLDNHKTLEIYCLESFLSCKKSLSEIKAQENFVIRVLFISTFTFIVLYNGAFLISFFTISYLQEHKFLTFFCIPNKTTTFQLLLSQDKLISSSSSSQPFNEVKVEGRERKKLKTFHL